MNWRVVIILGSILISLPMIFIGTVLNYGVTERQPATVTLDSSACRLLPQAADSSDGSGMCRLNVGDLRIDGKLVELWLAEEQRPLSEGQAITIPAEALKLAVNLPRQPAPAWMRLLPYAGMLLFTMALVVFGMNLRRFTGPRTQQ